MQKNKVFRYLGLSLIALALLTTLVLVVNSFALPLLSASISQTVLISVAIISGISGFLASLNDILDLFQKVVGGETTHIKDAEFLMVTIEKAETKYLQKGSYWIQVNLRFHANEKDVYLRKIFLKKSRNPGFANPNTPFGENGLPVQFLMPYQEGDLLNLNPDQFYEKIKDLEPQLVEVRDMYIKAGSYVSKTFIGDLHSERLSDGWDTLPLKDWFFLIEYGDNEQIKCKFSFSVNPSSPKYPVEFEYYGF